MIGSNNMPANNSGIFSNDFNYFLIRFIIKVTMNVIRQSGSRAVDGKRFLVSNASSNPGTYLGYVRLR